MRPTTKRRLLILFVVSLIVIVGGGAFVLLRMEHLDNLTKQERVDGMAAYEAGHYDVALGLLSDYLSKYKEDGDALYAFAVTRSMVALPNGQHLLNAISYLNNYLDLRKGDSQGQHKLLELYARVHWNPEILSLSNEILQAAPNDLPALRAKANALSAQSNYVDALTVAKKINELAPLDLDSQRTTQWLMIQLKRPPAELVARAKADMAAHPGDPRFELLMASAYNNAGDQENMQKSLLSAVARKAPDAEFVKLATKILDSSGSYDMSQQLLDRAVVDLNDPAVLELLVERLWQNGQMDEMAKRLESVKADDPKADTNLLAMKAISLLEHNQAADALTVVKVLAARSLDDEAYAWATAIPAKYAVPAPTARDAVLAVTNAANRDRDNSIIRLWVGEAYDKLGEKELAIGAWHSAANLQPAWAEPHVRQAKALAVLHRGSEAEDEALAAAQRAPSAISTRSAIAMSLSALSSDDPRSVPGKQLLEFVAHIQKDAPNEPDTLPMYVSLLTLSGQRPQAITVIKNAVAANPALSTDTLLRLAAVSGQLNLGMQQPIFDALAQAGDKSPELALAKANLLLAQGKGDQGLQLLKDSAVGTADPAAWQVATAQFLDASNSPDAVTAWKNAVEQFPNDLRVQSAFLKSETRQAARPVWAATIERLKGLTVEEGVAWRTERAKYLLSGNPTDRDRADAVTMLQDLIRSNPDLVEPRLLLASTMVATKNPAGAIEQLKFAAQQRPNDPQITLSLAQLLIDNGKAIEGQAYLAKVASGDQLSPSGIRVVAQMMADQGQADQAIRMLLSAPGEDVSRDAMVAQLYRRLGKNDEAAVVFGKLATAKPITTDALTATADFYFSRGQADQASAALARLEQASDFTSAGQAALIRAQMAELYQSPAAAKTLYDAAVKASPDAQSWRALAGFDIRQHKYDDAKAVLAQATAAVKDNPELTALQKLVDAAVSLPVGADVNDELAALSHDPLNACAQDLFNAGIHTVTEKDSRAAKIARFKAIADAYPKSWPANQKLIQAYIDGDQLDNARKTSILAANAFPNEAGPLQLLASIYSAQSDWSGEMATVQQWRSRAPDNQRACDVAAADAMIGMGQRRQAMATLQPYLAASKQDPVNSMDVLWLYGRALLQDGRTADASALLIDSAHKHPSVRRLWLAMVSDVVPNDAAVVAWINQVQPLLDANSPQDQAALANAWFNAAWKYKATSSFAIANKLLRAQAEQADSDPGVWAKLGEGLRSVNDLSGAEDAYRQALLRGDTGYSANALAFLLLTEDKSMDEALGLANKAIADAPRMAGYYDTRGQIYLHTAKYDMAIKDFDQALTFQPDLTDSMVGKAQALKKSGQTAKAAELLKYIDSIMSNQPDISPYSQKQLAELKAASAAN